MFDVSCTIEKLKYEVIEMCRRKGWGDDGIQNPQHVTMAMMVETMELLEHFADMSDDMADDLLSGGANGLRYEIAEEMSDVLMYSMQLMYTMKVDVSREISDTYTDGTTTIAQLKEFVEESGAGVKEQAMNVGVKARFVLEVFQWMNDMQVAALVRGEAPAKCAEAGSAFAEMFREVLRLANMLNIDIAGSIARKIAIVDKRVYPDDDPVR
ncbi:MAG: hypothetical protein IJC56_08625 [Clostridia bacterium]|nr:hypothetical protein [Clostridia bacterium]